MNTHRLRLSIAFFTFVFIVFCGNAKAQFSCPADGFLGRFWTPVVPPKTVTVDGCIYTVRYCRGALIGTVDFDALYFTAIEKLNPNCTPTKSEGDVIADIKDKVFKDMESGLGIDPCTGEETRYYSAISATCWKLATYPNPCVGCGPNSIFYLPCSDGEHFCIKSCLLCWVFDEAINGPKAVTSDCTVSQTGSGPTCDFAAPNTSWISEVCFMVCQ